MQLIKPNINLSYDLEIEILALLIQYLVSISLLFAPFSHCSFKEHVGAHSLPSLSSERTALLKPVSLVLPICARLCVFVRLEN